jgi:hypothetical protein
MINGLVPRDAVALMGFGFPAPLAVELTRQMTSSQGDVTALMAVGVAGMSAESIASAITAVGAH